MALKNIDRKGHVPFLSRSGKDSMGPYKMGMKMRYSATPDLGMTHGGVGEQSPKKTTGGRMAYHQVHGMHKNTAMHDAHWVT